VKVSSAKRSWPPILSADDVIITLTKSRIRFLVVGTFLVLLSGTLVTIFAEPIARHAARWLASRLETRFERPVVDDWTAISGLVVLGGEPGRIAEALRLARAHPHLRVVLSGPSDYELSLLTHIDQAMNSRIEIERNSLKTYVNTCGNAIFSARLIAPKPADRWLLITSALHMPRAVGAFRKAGFPVEPWPVRNVNEYAAPSLRRALHEWVGLVAYRLLGCSDDVMPGP
jgi:uncharacterized SAM-binding protein YcdF (DUF218 family)